MLKAGRFRLPVQYIKTEGRIFLKFGYNKKLLTEVKTMEGQRWHGHEDGTYHELLRTVFKSIKCWSIADSPRNRFQLAYLAGEDVYSKWDRDIDLSLCVTKRPLFGHQTEMVAFAKQAKYCILAAEMATGKSLAAIEVMEQSGHSDWWYISPRSGLAAVEREFKLWDCKVSPELMTYGGLTKRINNWSGEAAPKGLILDEASKAKTPTANRSKACLHLANAIRDEHGDDGSVILMSGSPAPKSPADWWHLCEIAWPGFIKEGNRPKFELRLGVFELTETPQGSTFNKRVTWLDDPKKCQDCGQLREAPAHQNLAMMPTDHTFVKSKDEITALNRRMAGLVKTWFKRDCLDLPEKVYRTIHCEPMPSTLRAAQVIKQATPRAAQALILLRELSDGFQYQDIPDGIETCTVCNGTETIICPDTNIPIDCVGCGGSGSVDKYTRIANRVKCPKDDALISVLDEHFEIGRLVIYAGFQASVDRVCEISLKEYWTVVRWDGRGTRITGPDGPVTADPLDFFNDHDGRVVFVGHPGSSGMGLNLQISPTILYYSNDFNAESRIQSEDRIHRPGCKGAQIIDLIHLPTDLMVLDNLKEKRRIQNITMGQIDEVLKD